MLLTIHHFEQVWKTNGPWGLRQARGGQCKKEKRGRKCKVSTKCHGSTWGCQVLINPAWIVIEPQGCQNWIWWTLTRPIAAVWFVYAAMHGEPHSRKGFEIDCLAGQISYNIDVPIYHHNKAVTCWWVHVQSWNLWHVYNSYSHYGTGSVDV